MFALSEPGPAEPLELALLQDAQELRLRRQAHLADLVEEQHAAGRQLDLARLGLLRARERAALVAEQLRLEQLLRQGGAIQGDERSGSCARHAMDEPRDDFLAGAGLAGHQHGRIGRGDLRRLAQHLAPFGRLSDDPQAGRPPSDGRRLAVRPTSTRCARASVDVMGDRPTAPTGCETEVVCNPSRDWHVRAVERQRSLRPERDPHQRFGIAGRHPQDRAVAGADQPLGRVRVVGCPSPRSANRR